MGNAGCIISKPPPVRKRRTHKVFPTALFKISKPSHHPPQVAGFGHAGTLAGQIRGELWVRSENARLGKKIAKQPMTSHELRQQLEVERGEPIWDDEFTEMVERSGGLEW